jgi:hypothetical protein
MMGRSHETLGDDGFARLVADMAGPRTRVQDYENLTGAFAIAGCDADGATLITDPQGFYAVYDATSPDGSRRVLGTVPEMVAETAGRHADYDLVSLAEILVRGVATFPYTSRNGMVELAPGSRHRFRPPLAGGAAERQTATLWLPFEPDRWLPLAAARNELIAALRYAGEDITRGSNRVAVTLSGGVDSRTALACVPRERLLLAATFADHENNETRVARAVARTAGVRHHLAWRSPEFYAQLAERETNLLGIERGFINSHGFALSDSPPAEQPDLLVCGERSDTLLKGLYTAFTPSSLFGGLRHPVHFARTSSRPSFARQGIHATLVDILDSRIRQEMESRVNRRLADIAEIRPRSAKEWFCFYPQSRAEQINYSAANARLFPSSLLFGHVRVAAVACSANPLQKALGYIATPAFAAVMGSLADVDNANTGVSPNAGPLSVLYRLGLSSMKRRFGRRHRSMAEASPIPWYTNDSWIDFSQLQQQSPFWAALRTEAIKAADGLDGIFVHSAYRYCSTYRAELGPAFNYSIVKLLNALRSRPCALAP